MKKDKSIIAQELGRRGGQKTLKNKGKKHYSAMSRKRWDKERSYAQVGVLT